MSDFRNMLPPSKQVRHGQKTDERPKEYRLTKRVYGVGDSGATKISHLEESVNALAVKMTLDEVAYLEEPYAPHRIVGHQ